MSLGGYRFAPPAPEYTPDLFMIMSYTKFNDAAVPTVLRRNITAGGGVVS